MTLANVRKGHLTSAPQWAVHLRKYWKRVFWKGERGQVKKEIKKQLKE